MRRHGWNQRKGALLRAIRSRDPAYVTARQVLETLPPPEIARTPAEYDRELRVISTRLLVLSTKRDADAGKTWGYSRPYLSSRLVEDEDTGRKTRAYRLSAKGASVLSKMAAGKLRGLQDFPARLKTVHDGRVTTLPDGTRGWACGRHLDCTKCYAAFAARAHPGTLELELTDATGEPLWDCGLAPCEKCERAHSEAARVGAPSR